MVSFSERASTGAVGLGSAGCAGRGRVLVRCCVAVTPSGSASERASTGAVGLGSGGCAGRGHDSPSARDSFTMLPSRGPCLAKEESWRRLWPRRGSDSPSSWNGPREGRSTDHPPHESPGGRTILPSRAPTRLMLRSRRDPVANAASFEHSRTNAESCVPRSRVPRAHPSPVPSAGRGPFGGRPASQPQQRSSGSRPTRGSAAAGEDPPRGAQPQAKTHPGDAAADEDPPRGAQQPHTNERGPTHPIGSTGFPPRSTMKCRWQPVDIPVEPTRPTTVRGSTRSPRETEAEDRWA